jgi:membrane fusion protein, heavy metal efflux system
MTLARLLSASAITLTLFVSCGRTPVDEADTAPLAVDEVALSPEALDAGGIEVQALVSEPFASHIDAPAVLRLDQQRTARVGALIDARVDAVHRDVGDTVRRNELLATLHSHVTHDAVAALRTAASEIARLEGELAFARESRARFQRLLADGAASRQEVERAETTIGTLERQIEAAKAEQTRARSELAHFGIATDRIADPDPEGHAADQIPVRTPLDGVVLERLVTPGTTVTSGQPLFVVSDLTALWAVAEFDERHVAALSRGRDASVTVAAYPGQVFTGVVTYVGDVVDPVTRRLSVRVELRNPGQQLKPEMFATLSLPGPEESMLLVPADAVQRLDGRDVVFVETAPHRFSATTVRTAPAADGRAVLLDGVSAGTRVVIRGAFLVKSELQRGLLGEEP